MPRFIEGQDRQQVTLMPECLDDFIADDNLVRVIDAFVGELDLTKLGFEGAEPAATGRPSYHPMRNGRCTYDMRSTASRRLLHATANRRQACSIGRNWSNRDTVATPASIVCGRSAHFSRSRSTASKSRRQAEVPCNKPLPDLPPLSIPIRSRKSGVSRLIDLAVGG